MENATEALKMAFAVLVFVIAMSLGFMLISQARSTADVVFATTDKQEYVEGVTSIGKQDGADHRTVSLDTIIPVIYRYAQENYGVTIVDNSNNIIAIYDLQVENTVSSISSTWSTKPQSMEKFRQLCKGEGLDTDNNTTGIEVYIKQATGTAPKSLTSNDFEQMYSITNPNSTSCPWTSSTYNIARRIESDMTGSSVSFGANPTNPANPAQLVYKNQLLRQWLT